MDIITVLKERYEHMTRKQKQLADFMMTHPKQMTFITLKDLSNQVGITEVTILRACNEFGYASFNEVKYEFRKYASMVEQFNLHHQNAYMDEETPESLESTEKGALLRAICAEEKEQMLRFVEQINYEHLQRAAQIILKKKKVLLIGRGFSMVLAKAFSTLLISSNIVCIPVNTELNDEVHSYLPLLDQDVVAMPISFPDYYFMTTKVAEFAHKSKATVIGITNDEKAPIVPFCDEVLFSPSSTRLYMNTLSSAMMLVNLLCSAVEIEGRMEHKDSRKELESRFSELFEDQ